MVALNTLGDGAAVRFSDEAPGGGALSGRT